MNKIVIIVLIFFELIHNIITEEVIINPFSRDNDKNTDNTSEEEEETNPLDGVKEIILNMMSDNTTDDYTMFLRSLEEDEAEENARNGNDFSPINFNSFFHLNRQNDSIDYHHQPIVNSMNKMFANRIPSWRSSIQNSRNQTLVKNEQPTSTSRYSFDAEPRTYTQIFEGLLERFAELTKTGFDIRGPVTNNKSDPLYDQFMKQLTSPVDSNLKSSKCPYSITTVNGGEVCEGVLIFEDDFKSMNTSKWLIERQIATGPDYEFVVYMDNPLCIFTQHGKLQIKPTRLEHILGENAHLMDLSLGENCTGLLDTDQCRKSKTNIITQPIISGRLTTRHLFQFLYGRVEIRARLPAGDWIFPQLLLESATNMYGKNRLDSGQMRIAFINGNNRTRLTGGPLFGAEEPMRTIKMCEYKSNLTTDWTQQFHNYTLEWRPTGIIMAVDGVEYCHIKPDDVDKDNGFSSFNVNGTQSTAALYWKNSGSIMAPFDREFYLTIGVGVGGFNDYPDEILIPNTDNKTKNIKPWENYTLQAMRDFYNVMRLDNNWPIPNKSILKVESIRVYAL